MNMLITGERVDEGGRVSERVEPKFVTEQLLCMTSNIFKNEFTQCLLQTLTLHCNSFHRMNLMMYSVKSKIIFSNE